MEIFFLFLVYMKYQFVCLMFKRNLKSAVKTFVFQEYDDEWGEYLDIDEVDLASLKDKGKLRVILKENVSI